MNHSLRGEKASERKSPSRRESLMLGAGALALGFAPSRAPAADDLILRSIPHSGEKLPTVGLGTARVFDVGTDAAQRTELEGVVSALVAGGGSVIDTSSDYGSAEAVVGDLVQKLGMRQQVFIATKIRSGTDAKTAHAEFERGLKRLKTDSVDLLQLHNVSRADESLAQLREWKAMKLCRYIGVTSTYEGDYDAMEAIIRREKPDFVQVAYSLGDREAESASFQQRRKSAPASLPRSPSDEAIFSAWSRAGRSPIGRKTSTRRAGLSSSSNS